MEGHSRAKSVNRAGIWTVWAIVGVVLLAGVALDASRAGIASAQTAGTSYTLIRPNRSLAGFVTLTPAGFSTQMSVMLQGEQAKTAYVVTVCIGDPSNSALLTCTGPANTLTGPPVPATVTTDASGSGTGTTTFGGLAPGTIVKVVNTTNPADVAYALITAQSGSAYCSFSTSLFMGTGSIFSC